MICSANLLSKACRLSVIATLLTVAVQLPSLRAIFKFLPHPEYSAVLFLGVAIFFSYAILSDYIRPLTALLDKKFLPYAITLALAVVNWFAYPIIDGRKAQGLGSTGDDAMIEPIRSLLAGGSLYDARLYDGVPISPGPGWLLLNAPLTLAGVYFLITPLYLLLTTLLFRSWATDNIRAATAMIILLSSPMIWELMTNGHDLIALGCCLALLPLACFQYAERIDMKLVLLAVVCGLVTTSRIVLLPLPLLLAAFLWKRSRPAAMIIASVGLTTAVGLHLVFYVVSDHYPPLHLLGRGQTNVGHQLIMIGAVASFVFGIVALKMYKPTFESMFFWYGLCLLLPFFVISLGEFQSVGRNFARWEGANYLLPALPSVVFSWCMAVSRRKRKL